MDEIDRRIVNALQGGFPLASRPYAAVAQALDLSEDALLGRLRRLLDAGTLTRFGPLYDAERLGGAFTLCAMSVPREDFERVAALVNAYPEVAHNYERDHRFNLWFVLAVGAPERVAPLLAQIEAETGHAVLNLPRVAEYFVELRLVA